MNSYQQIYEAAFAEVIRAAPLEEEFNEVLARARRDGLYEVAEYARQPLVARVAALEGAIGVLRRAKGRYARAKAYETLMEVLDE